MELFCLRACIFKKRKKKYLTLTSNIIDKKISLEFMLKYFSNFEKLKSMLLNKEEQEKFYSISNFKLDQQIKEMKKF